MAALEEVSPAALATNTSKLPSIDAYPSRRLYTRTSPTCVPAGTCTLSQLPTPWFEALMLSYDPSMAIDAAYGLAYVDDSSAPRRLSIEDAPSSAQRLEVTGSGGGIG